MVGLANGLALFAGEVPGRLMADDEAIDECEVVRFTRTSCNAMDGRITWEEGTRDYREIGR